MVANNELYNIKDVIDFQINSVARNSPITYSELYQIGYEGYLKAQKNYNPDYGKISLSYVGQYIRQELLINLRKEYKFKRDFDLYDNIEEEFEEVLSRDTAPLEDNINLGRIKQLLSLLTEVERKVIKDYFLIETPKTLEAIGKDLGVTFARVHQIKKSAIEELTKLIIEYGEIKDSEIEDLTTWLNR